MGAVAAAVAAVFSFLAILLEWWMKRQPTRTKEMRDAETQTGRQDITAGDTDDVRRRLDQLLAEVQSDGPTGKQSDEDISRRFSAL
jgi:hypothetical protein